MQRTRCRRSGALGHGTITSSPPSCNREQKGRCRLVRRKFCEMNVTARTTSTTGVRLACAGIRIPNFLKQLCHNTRRTVPPFPSHLYLASLTMQSVLPPYHEPRHPSSRSQDEIADALRLSRRCSAENRISR